MADYESYLARWQAAGVLNAEAADRIRAWEQADEKPSGLRWQVTVALICGGLLLSAGVVLFVAAHWENVSPGWRFILVMGMLALFHGAALAVGEKFGRLKTVLHGVGTVASGAAIALVGQIFNMQEHWPAAILLWALCASIGWWMLQDQVQQTFTLLLTPAWVMSEWSYRYQHFHGTDVYECRMLAVWSIVYVLLYLRSERRFVRGVLFSVGAVGLVISCGALAYGWGGTYLSQTLVPLSGRCAVWGLILLLPLFIAAFRDKSITTFLPLVVVEGVVVVLPFMTKTVLHHEHTQWTETLPSVFSYLLVAALTVFLAWWGVRLVSKLLINSGMIAFGLTVIWFYFSDLMNKMDRSLGLIGLGLLFFLGGWLLEKVRRRLVTGIAVRQEAQA